MIVKNIKTQLGRSLKVIIKGHFYCYWYCCFNKSISLSMYLTSFLLTFLSKTRHKAIMKSHTSLNYIPMVALQTLFFQETLIQWNLASKTIYEEKRIKILLKRNIYLRHWFIIKCWLIQLYNILFLTCFDI